MNTDVKTLTLGNHPITGEDKLEVYDGSGWRSTFRAQKVKDLKTRLEIESEGYKGFIVLKDYDVVRLRGKRQANKRVDDKYATRADYVTGEEATDFYRDAKKQAEVNRKLKMNAFPSVDRLTWADLVKLHEALAGIKVGDDTPRQAQFGREIANNITSNLYHPSFTDNGLAIFSFDMNGEDYRLILGVKGLFMENGNKMKVSLKELNQIESGKGVLSAEEYGNALMESLGTVQTTKSDPGFVKIIKAEMGRSEDISMRSKVIPIKGDHEVDFEKDLIAANNKGTPSFIYLNTNRRATYIHINSYGAVKMFSPVIFFNDVVDEEGEGPIEADFMRKRSRPQFRDSSLSRVIDRLDFSRGYAGIIVLAVE